MNSCRGKASMNCRFNAFGPTTISLLKVSKNVRVSEGFAEKYCMNMKIRVEPYILTLSTLYHIFHVFYALNANHNTTHQFAELSSFVLKVFYVIRIFGIFQVFTA